MTESLESREDWEADDWEIQEAERREAEAERRADFFRELAAVEAMERAEREAGRE